MSPDEEDPATTIRDLVNGYQLSQAIHVAATLGIAGLLAEGPRTSDALAAATACHPPTLYRLLRALASAGVLRELDERRFELTPVGHCLRPDHPASIAGWAAFIGRPPSWNAWGALLHSVRTGENAFEHVHGTGVWQYRAAHPGESAIFDRAMTSLSRRGTAALLAAYDFGRFRRLVDVGGGNGALLAAILGAYPALEGVLFDQPHVVAGAGALLEEAGVADRCEIVEGSFFDAVPAGADGYLMRAIIHDWEDEPATRILATIRRAMPEGGTLLIVDRVLAPPNEGRDGKLSDLNMLVGPGGQERTREEFAVLLDGAGFRLERIVGTGLFSVVEGVPR